MAIESILVRPGNCISRMQDWPYVTVKFHSLAFVVYPPFGLLGVNIGDEVVPRCR